MKDKYILIGIPGCGKSTLGKRVAENLDIPFIDLDKMARGKMDPEHQFIPMSYTSTSMFLNGLYKSMIEVSKLEGPAIIEAGAEAPLMPECATIMLEIGITIHVTRDIDKIIADIQKKEHRLILKEVNRGTIIDTEVEGVKLYAKELHKYEDMAILLFPNDGTEDEGVEMLTKIIKAISKQ
ncbi:MAG: AAA family ATPase [Oscillospiraceae bacterium]|nr:AAA family ATPase [Oscillospiraceae bacterium]